jgi:hypothetical protein
MKSRSPASRGQPGDGRAPSADPAGRGRSTRRSSTAICCAPMATATTSTSTTRSHAARPQHPARDAARKELGTRLPPLWRQPRHQLQDRLDLQPAPRLPQDLAQLAWAANSSPSARSVRTAASPSTSTNRSTSASATSSKPTCVRQQTGTGIYQNNDKLAVYRVTQGTARLGGGINLGLLGQIRAGWQETWWNPGSIPDRPFFPKSRTLWRLVCRARPVDQTDRLYFPTSGWTSTNALLRLADRRLQQTRRRSQRASRARRLGAGEPRCRTRVRPSGNCPIYDPGSLGGMAT